MQMYYLASAELRLVDVAKYLYMGYHKVWQKITEEEILRHYMVFFYTVTISLSMFTYARRKVL